MRFKVVLSQAKRYKGFPDQSSRPEILCKKRVLRNFTKFTGKHSCQSLFFNEVAAAPKETQAPRYPSRISTII